MANNYGNSVAIDGDYAVVGASNEDKDGTGANVLADAGAVYILKYNGTTWGEIKKIVASDRATNDYFGYSVSISGSYIIVGAYYEDEDESGANTLLNAGSAYIFAKDQGGTDNWGQVKKIVASDRAAGDYFGNSVSISGSNAIVGANLEDEDATGGSTFGNAGSAYIFVKDQGGDGNWGQVKKIVASDRAAEDYFGTSVSISGNYVIVGAYYEDEDAVGGATLSSAGSAYLFAKDQGGTDTWGQVKKIVASDRAANDYFGRSVSISGNYVIVGAYQEDEDATGGSPYVNAGSAYLFAKDQGGTNNWGQIQKIVPTDRAAGDYFGATVSISGSNAIVGSYRDGEDASGANTLGNAGSAYIFAKDQGGTNNWGQIQKIVPTDRAAEDYFGFAVSISLTNAIVGAPKEGEDASGANRISNAGSSYIFKSALFAWDGSESSDWNTAGNWNDNTVPTATDNVLIPDVARDPIVNEAAATPAICKDLTLQTGAVLTIAAGKALTVSGSLTNDAGTTGLVINSHATNGTGSLKILGSVFGSATVERDMSLDKWHLISSPLASQPIINFLTNNVDIATSAKLTEPHYEFAMGGYASGSWSSFYLHDKPASDLFEVGKGYRVLSWAPFTQKLYFEGSLNTVPISSVPVETGWNLVGNPYTTALNINDGVTGFVSVNSTLLPESYAAAYFWDAATSAYIAVNDAYENTNAPVGQGFFVKAASAGTITFNSDMQVHDGSNVFKSSALPRPTITLVANNGIGSASTLIKFMDGASEGLDIGYDAGIFKGDPDFSVYTKLVEDNGIEFQLQYLPTSQYNKLVIPIGIDSKAASEIILSVETVQLDPNCKVILEDKLTNTYTDLSKGSYKAAVVADTKGADRFFLHTGDIISSSEDQFPTDGKLTAYAKGNKEIRVLGDVGEGAVATLYNGLGQVVLTKKLGAGNLNIIGLPNLKSGLYMLNINDKGTSHTIKVMVKK